VEALTTRKAMTANDTLILPYSLNEVTSSIMCWVVQMMTFSTLYHLFID